MAKREVKLLQGNEACVEGALLAGVRFYAGYPITPSTEIMEGLARRLPPLGGTFIQMEDEIASMAAVLGASLAGVKTMTATSGPGFSLKMENLGFGYMAEIPTVIVNVMRGGPSTGLPTMVSQADVMQARWGTHGDHSCIALAPSTVPEILHTTIDAINLSEKYRMPVILLLDEVIGHMREKVEIPFEDEIEIRNRIRPSCPPGEHKPFRHTETRVPPLANFGSEYRFHVTGLTHDENGFPTSSVTEIKALLDRMNDKVMKNRDDICKYKEIMCDDAEVLVVAYGSTARVALRSVREARAEGLKVGLFRPITLWPFPEEQLLEHLKHVSKVLVPELNQGQMSLEVERIVAGRAKVESLGHYNGELLTPDHISKALGL